MGTLYYGDARQSVAIDDRALAHLQLVIVTKLRRQESLVFSWEHSTSNGSGRTSLWVHPSLTLEFEYAGSRPPRINRRWVDELMTEANAPHGLVLVGEPQEPGDGEA